MSDSLGLELSKVLFRHEPTLLANDTKASARAAQEVANLLGCILAAVFAKDGEPAYLDAMQAVALKIHDSAMRTTQKAMTGSFNSTRQ